jgi:predicted nucleic acid-binding protein
MILLDTSVLINYFRNVQDKSVSLLDEIIERNIPYGICDFVYQELLQGTRTEKEFNTLKEYLETIPFYYLNYGKESYEKAALMNFSCRKSGITVRSTIDLLIAQIAIENKLYLLHSDKDFDFIASVIKDLKIYKRM